MRTYFFCPSIASSELNDSYRKIVAALRSAGLFVVASAEEHNVDIKKEELERMNQSGETLLDKMDSIVIEASQPDQEIGYLMAYAISQKKPLLYLYRKGTSERSATLLWNKKNMPDCIKFMSYKAEDVEERVREFIEAIYSGHIKEKPNIKFTLRITPQIERFLSQRAARAKKTKADYLREFIEKEMMGREE